MFKTSSSNETTEDSSANASVAVTDDDTNAGTNDEKPEEVEAVYAFVENSGRLDQIMANIQTLFLGR